MSFGLLTLTTRAASSFPPPGPHCMVYSLRPDSMRPPCPRHLALSAQRHVIVPREWHLAPPTGGWVISGLVRIFPECSGEERVYFVHEERMDAECFATSTENYQGYLECTSGSRERRRVARQCQAGASPLPWATQNSGVRHAVRDLVLYLVCSRGKYLVGRACSGVRPLELSTFTSLTLSPSDRRTAKFAGVAHYGVAQHTVPRRLRNLRVRMQTGRGVPDAESCSPLEGFSADVQFSSSPRQNMPACGSGGPLYRGRRPGSS